ncbi:MAG: ATP phosphoribosyltransferase [Spirochaetales bacterium]|nr:ATP phosphoribosyltransferase [Spirochaetales bacterium]
MEKTLRIAIQKSGRLSEKSLDIIKTAGITFGCDSRVLKEAALNFPLEFLYVRDDDIPTYVKDGIADIGIVGKNEADEKGFNLEVIRDLGFASCRLSIAVPLDFNYEGLQSLEGKRIATSYPNILSKILKENGVKATFVEVSGSVEITPQIGVADCICDLVSTGTTLKMNGLKEVEPVYYSSAIMIASPELRKDAEKTAILERLLVRMDAVNLAKKQKYILFNLPKTHLEKVAKIVGGMKSPTVTPLLDPEWVSVQSVVSEDRFWEVFESLRDLDAEGILVMNIEKMTE